MSQISTNLDSTDSMGYEDIVAIAKDIHPHARVRRSDSFEHGDWEIYISTNFKNSHELAERFRDTPAWVAENTYANGSTELGEWGDNNGYHDEILDKVADYYNLQHGIHKIFTTALNARNESTGVEVGDWTEMSAETFKKYRKNRMAVEEEFKDQFTGMRAILDDAWLND